METESFIGESIDCFTLGEGTIIDVVNNTAKIYLEEFDQVIDLPLDEMYIEDEEQEELEELSKKTLGDYVKAASRETQYAVANAGGSLHRAKKDTNLLQRRKGIYMAVDKLTKEETEELEELSKKTLGNYIKKASDDKAEKRADQMVYSAGYGDEKPTHRGSNNRIEKIMSRRAGIAKAVRKLTKEEVELEEGQNKPYVKKRIDAAGNHAGYKASNKHGNVKFFGKDFKASAMKHAGLTEEVEELDELSKKTLSSYVKKANNNVLDRSYDDSINPGDNFRVPYTKRDEFKITSRFKGIDLANKKMKKEEVELDELKTTTYKSYLNKSTAARSAADAGYKDAQGWTYDDDTASNLLKYHKNEYRKRDTGISMAAKKLTKNLAKEEVELEEARGRPPKQPKEGEKPTAAWKRHLERKDKGEEQEEFEALGAQLRKAASINKPVTFTNGDKAEISNHHINKFWDHMDAREGKEKHTFQNAAQKSHSDFKNLVSQPVPKKETGKSSIVKYR